MPPPLLRVRKDSARSDHDDVFSEDSPSPSTKSGPLPLPIKEEQGGARAPGEVVLAPQQSLENAWDRRRGTGGMGGGWMEGRGQGHD